MQLAYGQIRQEKRMHEEIEGQKNERGKTVVSKKKVAIILAVATLSLATVSVAAGVYIRWSDGLKEKLQLTKAQEEELEETGAAESTGVSCTSQGITVTALQSITDHNFSQLAFSVKGYSVEMKEQPEFEQIIVKTDGKEVNVSGSFRNFGEEDEPVYQKADGTMEYLMQIDTNEKNGLAGNLRKFRYGKQTGRICFGCERNLDAGLGTCRHGKRGRIVGQSDDRRYGYGSKIHRDYAAVSDDPL